MSSGRMVCLATFFIVACIVALGIGLGVILTRKLDEISSNKCMGEGSEAEVTTTRTQPTTTPSSQTGSIEGKYRYAAIASDADQICSTIGTDIMARKGGTAVDAAIAAILCQCVHNTYGCGIGGGHFMTVYNRETRTGYSIIAREMAPGAADENMFVPDDKSSTLGGLAIGIPGEMKGLHLAWTLGGRVPWRDLFQPTIKLLREGWVVRRPLNGAIRLMEDTGMFQRFSTLRETLYNPVTRSYYKEGDIIRMPKLAQTFQIIAEEGPDAFYNGSLSDDIVREIQDAGGIITREDLVRYEAVKTEPLVIKLKDESTVYSPPLPSSGVVLEFILNILDEYGFTKESISTPDKAIATWHRIIEAMKFAFAKRSSLGDLNVQSAEFNRTLYELIHNMTSDDYAKSVVEKIDDQKTFGTMFYGPTFYDSSTTGTSHLSVLGPKGDAVAITSTSNLQFGSKIIGNKTGIIYNNEMDDFSTPNTTNAWGIPASEANFIKPYKRPFSSMCPSIVVSRDGHVKLIVGASGGAKITSSSALVSIETLWLGKGIKEAIDQKRVHHQLLPPYITIETGFDQRIIGGLRAKGHNITMASSAGSIVQGILQLTEEHITAYGDDRKYGHTDGY